MPDARERPILFSAPMVLALLAGRKTQTRRVIQPQPRPTCEPAGTGWHWHPRGREDRYVWSGNPEGLARRVAEYCPYGRPGDRLWVRETWARRADVDPEAEREKAVHYLRFRADRCGDLKDAWHGYGRWRSSLHMPRWASRLTLELTGVRAEPLQRITEADAEAEGFRAALLSRDGPAYDRAEKAWCRWSKRLDPAAAAATHRGAFAAGWEVLNGKRPGRSWEDNPWVWVLEFRRAGGDV